MDPRLRQVIPYGGAAIGAGVGSAAGTRVGMGGGALLGLLIADIYERVRDRSFLDKLLASLSNDKFYNEQLGLLAGSVLGGGLGNLGGSALGAYAGHGITDSILRNLGY